MRSLRLVPFVVLLGVPWIAAPAPLLSAADSERIVKSVARVVEGDPREFRFAVVADEATDAYVQFGNDGLTIQLDFPILSGSSGSVPGRKVRDAECSASPVRAQPGEVEERYRSIDEEKRLLQALDRLKVKWSKSHCLQVTQSGQRAGYIVTVQATLPRPEDAPAVVEEIFGSVYGVTRISTLRIKTDADR